MAEKTLKTRIKLKSDTQANWNNNPYFIPLQGEIIIYSPDSQHSYSRLKVGDGSNFVSSLPFIDAGTINGKVLEDVIIQCESQYAFPPVGQENKLYVVLDPNDNQKGTIYCYKANSGYSQLSHFKYTTITTQISTINSWNPGIMTTALVDDTSLIINNGTAPTLDLGTLNVVTSIQEQRSNLSEVNE